MPRRILASSRYIVFIAVIAALLASVALILYEAIVIAEVIFNAVTQGGFLPQPSKALAVGLRHPKTLARQAPLGFFSACLPTLGDSTRTW